jgi:hypothetical protein
MVLCDNAFCSYEVSESDGLLFAGRRFCCVACAEDWERQNEALNEAAEAFYIPSTAHRDSHKNPTSTNAG